MPFMSQRLPSAVGRAIAGAAAPTLTARASMPGGASMWLAMISILRAGGGKAGRIAEAVHGIDHLLRRHLRRVVLDCRALLHDVDLGVLHAGETGDGRPHRGLAGRTRHPLD